MSCAIYSFVQRVSPLLVPKRNGRFLAPGSFYIPFSERFDEESNRRPSPHPETPKFLDELPPATGPIVADKRPFQFVCEPNKIYWWCACGNSKEQPFCDGHHARSIHKWPSRNQKPMFRPIKVVFKTRTRVWFCTCKHTGSAPFCDGSHNCEFVQTAIKLPGGRQGSLITYISHWNTTPRRAFFWRRKEKQDGGKVSSGKSSPDSDDTHADLIWAEALKNFEQDKLVMLSRDTTTTTRALKHSQIKRIKKAAFLDTIELYKARSGSARRNFNEFILAALREMRAYEVADDLEAYKALLSVLPRGGRLKAKSFWHSDMGAYKQQQDTVTKLLMQLNANQVIPDDDVGNTIVEVFGFRSYVMTQYRRMMYWVPKLRYVNPWPVVEKLPDDIEGEDAVRLAQLAAARICPDPNTEFTTITNGKLSTEVNIPNYIVSAQSSTQRALLSAYITTLSSKASPRILYLDGPQFVWFRNLQLAYYVLWGHLDKCRLDTQIEKVRKTEERLKSISDPSSWNFPTPGSGGESCISLHPVIPTNASVAISSRTILPVRVDDADLEEDKFITLCPKRSSLLRRGNVITAERRRALWAGFGSSHQLTHLPENLSRHEQAEGTIFAVGVVAPLSNALENQARAYGGESNKEMPDPTCIMPIPAPHGLIQQWLNVLRQLNSSLDAATVIIRQFGGSGKNLPSEEGSL